MVACRSHYNRPELKCCSSTSELPGVELAVSMRASRVGSHLGLSLQSLALSGIELGLRAHI
jgi:hypothetical protein